MYERRSRLNSRQQSELIKFFVAGATALAAGEISGVNRNAAASYFMRLRRLIAMHRRSYRLSGEVEADESYFGGVRKGKRDRGAVGKIVVFGLFKRNGNVYTAIIPNARTETLMPTIEERVEPDSVVSTDMFWAYNALDVSDFHHHRIDHSRLFAKQGNHINGIENFWNQAKRHLRKFNGIKPEHFYCFLKECEWRFNGGNHKALLTQLNSWVKEAKHSSLLGQPPKKFYGAITDMIKGYMLWDTFNHKKSLAHLSKAQDRLAPYAVGNTRIKELLAILKRDVERVEQLQRDAAVLQSKGLAQEDTPGRAYLMDLLGNAQRCAAAGHYYDAVDRLYSAIEKRAKAALWARHGIDNAHVTLEQVPEPLREEWSSLMDEQGVARVGLERSYQLLAALDDPLGKAFLAQEKALNAALQSRNTSLLAHGYVPIREDKYEKLMATALEFLRTDAQSLTAFPHLDWKALLL